MPDSPTAMDLLKRPRIQRFTVDPELDRDRHLLLYGSLLNNSFSGEALTAQLFGRGGSLCATLWTNPGGRRASDYLKVFRSVIDNVRFQPGRSYEDYRAGDPLYRTKAYTEDQIKN